MNIIKKHLQGKILVAIDAANLESSVKSLGWWIDYAKLRDLFDHKKLVGIRNYCVRHKTENQNKFFTFLKKNGFILVTKPLKIIKTRDIETGDIRKANFDVEMAIDIMEMAEKFDTLVLFSGDSDFDYVLKKLRARGKKVVVISTRYHVSKELVGGSDKYIDLKDLRNLIERRKKAK